MISVRVQTINRGVVNVYVNHICFTSVNPCDAKIIVLHMDGGYELEMGISEYMKIGSCCDNAPRNNQKRRR